MFESFKYIMYGKVTIKLNVVFLVCKCSVPFLFADDGALYFDNVNRNSHGNISICR